MASTITLAATTAWVQPFMRYQSLTVGTSNEPAITSANTVKQTILSPPFIWRWNRATDSSTSTVAGTQDYAVALSTFGYFEKATVTDSNGIVTELEWKQLLSAESSGTLVRARPTFISTQSDDNAGNISFRLMPVPDAIYLLTIIFQKAPVLFAATTDTWAPIPDYMAYLYNRGLLAFGLELMDDARFTVEHTRFLAQLLSAAEGLTEMEKNIFLGNVLNTAAQGQNASLRTQQATQARGT
jgi:hypothetical protein